MPLGEQLRAAAARHPQKPALIFDQRTWTYGELDAATDRLAAGLIADGIRTGDRVALHFTNGVEIVTAYYACFKIGAIAVPLNTRMIGPELVYVLNHCSARLYLGQPALFAALAPLRAELQTIERYFVSGDASAFAGVEPFAALDADRTPALEAPEVADTAVAAILYTSGTTARPKGVTHTHATLRHLAQAGLDVADGRPDDVAGVALPTCHIFGLSVVIATLMAGNAALMIPRFDPVLVLAQLRDHGVTIFGGLPVMLNALVHCPGAASYDLGKLRACFAGGDAVPTEVHKRFKDTFGVDVTEACGMTEVQPYACNPLYGRGKTGSIGLPAPRTSLRIVDAFDRDVLPGEEGEVLVQSPAMMVGYWNDPDATAATIRDGWLRTGDLARVDGDGYYWFVGRKKEIIIRGGSNISPLEVEEALYQHPAVREVGVVGGPDETFGEIVLAFVSLKTGAAVSEEDLKAFVSTRIAAYKVPAQITFVPDLPKGLTGKVQRKALKELVARSG
ncbi:MAG TPA: AMP-binding protein [Vicinamibacterales bacterium]|nr:AMP-binding protein [Vicinamibacterales bacterium]